MSHLALLAPPWIPIPPPGYGGIEQVVRLLAAGLVDAGHRVTLFAPPGRDRRPRCARRSQSRIPTRSSSRCGRSTTSRAASTRSTRRRDDGDPFDVVHDHTGFAALAMATASGDARWCTRCMGRSSRTCSASTPAMAARAAGRDQRAHSGPRRPEHLRDEIAVVPNPLAVDEWPFEESPGDYLLWIARINDDKGPQRAIAAAREAGVRWCSQVPSIPGQEEFFAREVEPHIDDDAVRYVGEVGEDGKRELYTGARALLMPIRWAEPFGMVMVEAMACGTPVIAFPEGSAPEVVIDGETGFLVDDEDAMAEAIGGSARSIVGAAERRCGERFDVASVVARYEEVYERARDATGASAAAARRRPATAVTPERGT